MNEITTALHRHDWYALAALLVSLALMQLRRRPELAARLSTRWQWALGLFVVAGGALVDAYNSGFAAVDAVVGVGFAALTVTLSLLPGAKAADAPAPAPGAEVAKP